MKKEKKSKKRKVEEIQDDNNNTNSDVKRKRSDTANEEAKEIPSPGEKTSKTVVVNGYSVNIPNRRRTRTVSLSEESDPIAQKGNFSNFSISDKTVEKLKGM